MPAGVVSRPEVVVVGDCLLDRDVVGRVERVCPDAPVPVLDVEDVRSGAGGAGLTALLCAADGAATTLVAPLADDDEGRLLRRLLEEGGVRVIPLGHEGGTRVKSRLRAGGQSLARLDSGGPGRPVGDLPPAAVEALREAAVVLVSCYGAGAAEGAVRSVLAERAPRRPVVWDPHPRGGDPVPGCALVTPNLAEARARLDRPDAPGDVVAAGLVEAWSARAVAVTDGERGAWLGSSSGEPVLAPAAPAHGDTCGAGDRFAAAAATALAAGRTTSEAVVEAVARAGAFVAAGGASAWRRSAEGDGGADGTSVGAPRPHDTPAGQRARDVEDLVGAVRARGGTVVATGGCFDVLHAGHVATLERARSLGDALVVLLNSDASVERLKGSARPVHSEADRERVLRALACVDAVVVFDEDSPEAALGRLRPDVWAKGGDYEGTELPEADLVRSWGGRVVLLPYLSGRSTTAVLQSITPGAAR